jgi:hypothetical protein
MTSSCFLGDCGRSITSPCCIASILTCTDRLLTPQAAIACRFRPTSFVARSQEVRPETFEPIDCRLQRCAGPGLRTCRPRCRRAAIISNEKPSRMRRGSAYGYLLHDRSRLPAQRRCHVCLQYRGRSTALRRTMNGASLSLKQIEVSSRHHLDKGWSVSGHRRPRPKTLMILQSENLFATDEPKKTQSFQTIRN